MEIKDVKKKESKATIPLSIGLRNEARSAASLLSNKLGTKVTMEAWFEMAVKEKIERDKEE